MKKYSINWGYVILGLLAITVLCVYGRNKWLAHELQGEWRYLAVEVNNGELIPLSPIEQEVELTADGDYLINQQKESNYRFRQRFGRLYLQFYRQGSLDGPPFDSELLVRKHGDRYTLTNNEIVIDGARVATGGQLSKK